MEGVPEEHVEQHDGGLEDVEEPLVAQEGADRGPVEGRVQELRARGAEVLGEPVDGPHEDQARTGVEGPQHHRDVAIRHTGLAAAAVKGGC